MTAQYRAETTAQASAAGHQSAAAVDGIWQPPVLFLMPSNGGSNSGSGSKGGSNGGGSIPPSDPSTSCPAFAIRVLANCHGVQSS
jgi:hypothetical protein